MVIPVQFRSTALCQEPQSVRGSHRGFVEPHRPLHGVNRATGIFFFCRSLTAAEAVEPATGSEREDLRGGLHWSPQDATGHADNTVPSAGSPEMGNRRGQDQDITNPERRALCFAITAGGREDRKMHFLCLLLGFSGFLFFSQSNQGLCVPIQTGESNSVL